MAHHYIRFATMIGICGAPSHCSIPDLLMIMGLAQEFASFPLRRCCTFFVRKTKVRCKHLQFLIDFARSAACSSDNKEIPYVTFLLKKTLEIPLGLCNKVSSPPCPGFSATWWLLWLSRGEKRMLNAINCRKDDQGVKYRVMDPLKRDKPKERVSTIAEKIFILVGLQQIDFLQVFCNGLFSLVQILVLVWFCCFWMMKNFNLGLLCCAFPQGEWRSEWLSPWQPWCPIATGVSSNPENQWTNQSNNGNVSTGQSCFVDSL